MTTRQDDGADQPRCGHGWPWTPPDLGMHRSPGALGWTRCSKPPEPAPTDEPLVLTGDLTDNATTPGYTPGREPAPTDDVAALVADPQPEWSRDFILGHQAEAQHAREKARLRHERDTARRQVAAVRALCDQWATAMVRPMVPIAAVRVALDAEETP